MAESVKRSSFGEFDVLRGFAILVVIMGHTLFYRIDTFPYPGVVSAVFSMTKFFSIVIPLFYFITGYYSIKSAGRNPKRFIRSRLRLLLIPYLIWTTLYVAGEGVLGANFGLHLGFFDVLRKYLIGDAVTSYYFLFVLAVLYAVTPLLTRLGEKGLKRLLAPSFAAMLVFSSLYYIPLYFGKELIPLTYSLRNPLMWFFFYVWGAYTARKIERTGMYWRERLSPFWKYAAVLSYIGAVVELYAMPNRYQPGINLLGPVGFVYCALAIPAALRTGYLVSQKYAGVSRLLGTYGRHTLGIYLATDFTAASTLLVGILIYPNLANGSSPWINFIAFLTTASLLLLAVKSVWRWNKKVYAVIF